MGTEYYAINTQNKTFYDLGKGSWYNLTDMEAFQDEEYLCHEILDECYHLYDESSSWRWKNEADKQNTIDYVKTRIVPQLYEMMIDTPPNKIRIVNDCGDDIVICKAKRYRCVGTRYYELDSAQYTEEMVRLNKHLSNDPINKRWWDIDYYKQYPEFDTY